MRYRVLISIASSDGWVFQPGQVIGAGDRFVSGEMVPERTIRAWEVNGYVEMVQDAGQKPGSVGHLPAEVADAAPTENAAARKPRRRLIRAR